jgi:pyruvate formate-lyase activating enzyme-like uncharacterized protein
MDFETAEADEIRTHEGAFRRAESRQQSVHAAHEAMFSFGIEEPEYTRAMEQSEKW